MFQVTVNCVTFLFPTRQAGEAFKERLESDPRHEVSDVQYTGSFTYLSEDDGLEHTARTIDWAAILD